MLCKVRSFALLALLVVVISTPVAALPFAYIAAQGDNAVDVLNTITNRVEGRIALEGTPTAIAFSRDDATAYVAVIASSGVTPAGAIVVINTQQRVVVDSIPVGLNPAGIVITPDDHTLYVTNQGSNTVSVIEAAERVVTGIVDVGKGPGAIAITPDGTGVYVANSQSNSVSVIDPSVNRVVATVPTGVSASSIVVSPHSPTVYVTADINVDLGGVWVIDTSRHVSTGVIRVPRLPKQAAISPDGGHLYVASPAAGGVAVVDAATHLITALIPVSDVAGLTITSNGLYAYLSRPDVNAMNLLNLKTNTITAIEVPPGKWWIAVQIPPAQFAVVPVGNTLNVINTFSLGQTTITVSPIASLSNVAITPDGTKAYVTDRQSYSVWAVDLVHGSVLANIKVGQDPYGVAVTPNGDFAYVANTNSNTVTVVQTATNVAVQEINVGRGPTRLAITPAGLAYVANFNSHTVSVIDTNAQSPTVVATLGTSNTPTDITVSPDGSRVYVACLDSLLVVDATKQLPDELSAVPISDGLHGNVADAVTTDGSEVWVGNTGFVWVVETATLTAHKLTGIDLSDGIGSIRMDQSGEAYVLARNASLQLRMYIVDVKTERKVVSVLLTKIIFANDPDTMAITPPM